MNRLLKFSGVVLATLSVVGCAGSRPRLQQPWCSVIGGLVGAGAGVGVDEAIQDNVDTEERAIAAAAGAVVGATAGALLCAPRKAPEPVAAVTPAPLDSDGDGVTDDRDKCPGTPRGTRVDANGCPEVGESLARLGDVYFDFNKATLKPSAGPALEQAATSLRSNPNMSIRLEGHTDSVGSDGYNMRLSQRRADAVRRYLVGAGVNAGRLDALGKGETQPVASNASADGRGQNRRVEFIVSGK